MQGEQAKSITGYDYTYPYSILLGMGEIGMKTAWSRRSPNGAAWACC
jgi:hypothetical protein